MGRRKDRTIDWSVQPLGQIPDMQLARRLGVSHQAVWMQRTVRKIPAFVSGTGIDWDAQPLGQIPDTQLALRLGCSSTAVYNARLRRQIPRMKVRAVPKKACLTRDRLELLHLRYGLSGAEIGKLLDVDAADVGRALRNRWLEINGCDPGSGAAYVHRVPAADPAAGGAPNGNACTSQTGCACIEYTCTGARTVWCEYQGTGGNGHSWPIYYRDAAANWLGRFVDLGEPGGSSSGEGSSSSSSTTADVCEAPCEMVCQCP